MRRYFPAHSADRHSRNPLLARNWETDIHKVMVESCDETEDPLGYRAVFLLSRESARAQSRKSFAIGASFLARREQHLVKAGYKAPMTQQAIAIIEDKIGRPLPLMNAERVGEMA